MNRGRVPARWAAAVLLAAAACAPPLALRPVGPALPGAHAPLDARTRRWVERTLESLSLREKVGQLMMPWVPGAYAAVSSPEFERIARWVDEGIGGVSISIGLPHSYAGKLNELQRRARVPLLVAADFESGGPGMRLSGSYALPSLLPQGGGTDFPPTMAFGAIGNERIVHEFGRITGVEARAVGVQLDFAPVLDVNSNPENPIINTRAFGESPALVARLGVAFIEGARVGGMLTTAKHFPGHGDTRTDSHIDLPVVRADRARLDAVELVPFRRAAEAGVDAVMTAHVAVPGILGSDGPPATLSPYFLTRLLREELRFGGLVFTDAMTMGAITRRHGTGEAAVLALEAGADVILSPPDLTAAIDAVTAAVESGRIRRERLDAAVRRILEAKARAGLRRGRLVDLDAVDEIVGQRAHTAFADSVAALSITLPRDSAELLPVDTARVRRVLSVTFARPEDLPAGRTFDAILAERLPHVERVRVDSLTPPARYDSIAARAMLVDLVLASAYVPPQAGAGSVGVPQAFAAFVTRLVEGGKPTVLLSLGNPYLLTAVPSVGSYLVTWGGREVSQRAAARAILGLAPITGRLPISLPPFHRAGDGLDRRGPPRATGRAAAGTGLVAAARSGDRGGIMVPSGIGAKNEEVTGRPTGPRADPPREAYVGEADPIAVGMDPARLARVDSILHAGIADSVAPGAAIAVGRYGRLVRLRGYGRLDWAADAPPATDSSLYDVASLTKVVGTATAAMILAEEARLELDAHVARYLPWWRGGGKEGATIRQLLLHRAGLPPFRPLWREVRGREAYERAIAELSVQYPPGDSTLYSDIGLMVMGFVVERISGEPLDVFLRRRVFGPLGMRDTGFRPDPSLLSRIAPTEVDTVFRQTHVHGVVHDENAYALGGVAGHAGLFSSARDLAVFAQMMLDGGTIGRCSDVELPCGAERQPRRVLDRGTIERFAARHDSASSRALGWDTPAAGSSAGDYLSARAFGHTGFTGTSLWIDPELELFVVILTNRVNPSRDNPRIFPLRRAVHDAVVQALVRR
ncbi:MAG: serine hydrolase [Gemmatimonadetes bacterium]|nr:serine hydrolase [Gemmatimonadota bacterium]